MSRITKEIARQVSLKLTEKKSNQIKCLQNDLKQIVSSIYKSQLPKEVIDLYEKMPKYFDTTSNTRIFSAGFLYEYYYINQLPKLENGAFKVSDSEAKNILKLKDKIYDLKGKLEKLVIDIENTLFNLRTYKNVESNFKEAFEFLPKSNENTSVMINISDLRNQLKETV